MTPNRQPAQAKAIDSQQALQCLERLEAYVGIKFVRETVGFYRHRMRTASSKIDRLCRAEALHPLARALSDYLSIREAGLSALEGPLPEHVAQLAADADALFRFESSWTLRSDQPGALYLKKRITSKHDSMQCLYEFRIASFLELCGMEVSLRSGAPHRGHDLEAGFCGETVEVECKYMYP